MSDILTEFEEYMQNENKNTETDADVVLKAFGNDIPFLDQISPISDIVKKAVEMGVICRCAENREGYEVDNCTKYRYKDYSSKRETTHIDYDTCTLYTNTPDAEDDGIIRARNEHNMIESYFEVEIYTRLENIAKSKGSIAYQPNYEYYCSMIQADVNSYADYLFEKTEFDRNVCYKMAFDKLKEIIEEYKVNKGVDVSEDVKTALHRDFPALGLSIREHYTNFEAYQVFPFLFEEKTGVPFDYIKRDTEKSFEKQAKDAIEQLTSTYKYYAKGVRNTIIVESAEYKAYLNRVKRIESGVRSDLNSFLEENYFSHLYKENGFDEYTLKLRYYAKYGDKDVPFDEYEKYIRRKEQTVTMFTVQHMHPMDLCKMSEIETEIGLEKKKIRDEWKDKHFSELFDGAMVAYSRDEPYVFYIDEKKYVLIFRNDYGTMPGADKCPPKTKEIQVLPYFKPEERADVPRDVYDQIVLQKLEYMNRFKELRKAYLEEKKRANIDLVKAKLWDTLWQIEDGDDGLKTPAV